MIPLRSSFFTRSCTVGAVRPTCAASSANVLLPFERSADRIFRSVKSIVPFRRLTGYQSPLEGGDPSPWEKRNQPGAARESAPPPLSPPEFCDLRWTPEDKLMMPWFLV